jgi:GcrA cell cycle regulator
METGEMSGPSPWTDERDAQLTADWNAGFTTLEIGTRMGISKNSVIGRARRLRLQSRGSPINFAASQSWTKADDATLRAIYGGFLTAAQIAARMERSLHAISYRAKFLGLVAGRRASPRSRAVVARPAARSNRELPVAGSRAASPSRPRAATNSCGASPAVERQVFSQPARILPEAVAETPPPRVFSGTQCCHPVGDRTCNEPVRANARGLKSPYCPEHFALIYAAPPAKSANNPPPAGWLKNRDMVWARG